ncbi:MAG: hypothetical protein PVJ34_10080, partial [Anaerolineae bacterium]
MKGYPHPARIIPVGGLLLLMALFLAPMLLQPTDLIYPRGGQATDLTVTHWPAATYNARSLRRDGQVPLWRTTIASGGPWLANPLSGLTYPPTWLFFLLPTNLALNLLLAGHLLLAALATYVLGRQALGLLPPGAALAGLAFASAPWISGQLSAGHLNITMALAWLPLALLGIDRFTRTGRAGGALLAAVAWAAALVNYIQIGAFVAALSLAWFLLCLSRPGETAVSRRRQLALIALVPLLTLALSAVLLVPMAEALPYLNRTALSPDEAGIHSLSWAQLLTAFIPTYGGEPEQLIYLGLPATLLAAVGLALKRDRLAWFLVAAVAATVIFALGTSTPLFPLLVGLVPGLGWLRVPPRAWVLVAFCLALLAGRGLDALSGAGRDPAAVRRITLVAFGALVAGLTLAVGLLLLFRPAPPAAWSLAALTVLACAALLLWGRGVLAPVPLAAVFLLLVAADLTLVRAAWTEMRSPAEAFAWGAEAAEALVTHSQNGNGQQPGWFRTYSPDYSLPQHTAIYYDLYLADGTDPIQLTHYANFLATAGGYAASGYSPTLPPDLDDRSARPDTFRLGLLNVEYVAAGFPLPGEDLIAWAKAGETYIYHNEQVLPRAFVVPGATAPESSIDAPLPRPLEAQP